MHARTPRPKNWRTRKRERTNDSCISPIALASLAHYASIVRARTHTHNTNKHKRAKSEQYEDKLTFLLLTWMEIDRFGRLLNCHCCCCSCFVPNFIPISISLHSSPGSGYWLEWLLSSSHSHSLITLITSAISFSLFSLTLSGICGVHSLYLVLFIIQNGKNFRSWSISFCQIIKYMQCTEERLCVPTKKK